VAELINSLSHSRRRSAGRFFAIHHGAGGVFEFASAGRRVDRGVSEKETDFLRRFVAFALAIQMDPETPPPALRNGIVTKFPVWRARPSSAL